MNKFKNSLFQNWVLKNIEIEKKDSNFETYNLIIYEISFSRMKDFKFGFPKFKKKLKIFKSEVTK